MPLERLGNLQFLQKIAIKAEKAQLIPQQCSSLAHRTQFKGPLHIPNLESVQLILGLTAL